MIWAIGRPGARVRVYIETDSLWRVPVQCSEGEVAVLATEKLTWATIAEDGQSILPAAPPQQWHLDQIRARRNVLLSASDIYVSLPDIPGSGALRAEWIAYRQELRDLPAAQPGATLESVIWPVAPGGGA